MRTARSEESGFGIQESEPGSDRTISHSES
jgi:hypothetical protein